MSLKDKVHKNGFVPLETARSKGPLGAQKPARLRTGFTLIEMLVVVAIIGILSATVLVALGPSRDKAKDARIISGIQQARAIGEAMYNPSTGSPYAGFTTNQTYPDVAAIRDDIASQGGELVIILNVAKTQYGIYSKLASLPIKYFCVDSIGNVKTVENEAKLPTQNSPICKD